MVNLSVDPTTTFLFQGQQLLPTDTQPQIKRILMGERSAPLSRTGKQTGRSSQVSSFSC